MLRIRELPLLKSLRAADAKPRSDDFVAGAITAILLIPQGMAYALLAGLPPELGLYASIVPPAIYALLGSSRALAVGPVAVAALMVAHALGEYAAEDQARWIDGALILAFETGLVLLAMRLLRLGALVHFISHPVLSGFTSGAALLIIVSQLKHLTGLPLPRDEPLATVQQLASQLDQSNAASLLFGLGAVALLLLTRSPMIRGLQALGLSSRSAGLASRMAPLTIVLLATALAASLDASARYSLSVVGAIPAGLPTPSLDFLFLPGWVELAPSALLIALVGYVESISVAKLLAAKRRQRIDPNQELTALAVTNMAAAAAGTMPVAGGFSRSVVNFEAGARTQLAAIITAGLVAVVAVFFTDWFHHLPHAVLAAVIVVAVAQLIDTDTARHIFAYDRGDGITLVATLLGVLALGIEAGLVLGIILALSLYLRRTSEPHMAVLGRVPGTEHFRNIDRHAVDCVSGVLIIRVDENLYFANIGPVEDYIEAQLQNRPDTHTVLLVMSAVNFIDSSAEEQLELLEESLHQRDIALHMAEVKGPVMDRLRSTRLARRMAATRIHLSTHIALKALAGAEGAPDQG